MPRYESAAQAFAGANQMPQGPQAVRTLTDVKAPSPADMQVLTWVAAAGKWEPISPVPGIASFPITFTDGTNTFSLSISGAILTIKAYKNATPAVIASVQFDANGILTEATSGDMNVNPGRDWNLVAARDANLQPVGNLNLGDGSGNDVFVDGTLVNATGGSTGDVLTKQAGGQLSLQSPTTGTLAQDYRQSFLLMGA